MKASRGTFRSDKYVLPARNLFDVIATHDITVFLTLVRGVNPFDHSPGMQLILSKHNDRPVSANPFVISTNEIDVDVDAIATVRDAVGNTALHVAAGNGYVDMVHVLLEECGAEVDAVNAYGLTPLHAAARNGHTECVKLLLNNNASVLLIPGCADVAASPRNGCERATESGRTALFAAHYHGHYPTAAILAPCYDDLVAKLPRNDQDDATVSAALTSFVRGEAVANLALLFDVMDCEFAGCGPLLHSPKLPSIQTMRRCILGNEGLLGCLLPAGGEPVSEALLFIIHGLATHGFFGEEHRRPAETHTAHPILLKALRSGHTEVVRHLIGLGFPFPIDSVRPLLAAPADSNDDGDATSHEALSGKASLFLELAELQQVYELCMTAYRHKPSSKRRKLEAWEAKVALREKEREARAAGVLAL